MSRESSPELSEAALLIRAVAGPLRLRILHLLSKAEICHCHFSPVLQLQAAAIDVHLRALRKKNLITASRGKFFLYYQLAKPESPLHAQLLQLLSIAFAGSPTLADDLKRLARIQDDPQHAGGCLSHIDLPASTLPNPR